MRRSPRAIGSLLCMLALAACTAEAPRAGDPARGRLVAQEWCAGCHDISIAPVREPARPAPAFLDLSRRARPDFSDVRRFMEELHPPMPTFRLWPEEKENVLAYLHFLRHARAAEARGDGVGVR
ncbi:MAG: hypothetical protein KIT20_02705 [Alphaproteobacteria bacterium]|nr:hypothetical protein [Alphaproteobacteria bacterium]